MYLVYYHFHFFTLVPRGLVKLPRTFSLYSVLHFLIYGVAD